jgi:hypothetical protein
MFFCKQKNNAKQGVKLIVEITKLIECMRINKSHPYLSQQQYVDTWKPHITRDAAIIELDWRAKAMVEDACVVRF